MTMLPHTVASRLRRSARDEEGGMTIFALYVLAGALLASAFAVDFAYLQSARTQLQVAADSAAHAALYYRETNPADEAKDKAIIVASHDMPTDAYGAVLTAEHIEFGDWDEDQRTFTPNPNSVHAVRVRPSRESDKGNAVTAYLFRLLNKEKWDIGTEAIFVTYMPPCLREGFVAEGVVDIQSNNAYFNGFCLHSNSYVSINSNNYFEQGTVVSMPDLDLLDVPNSGFETNEGLQLALRRGYYRLRMLNKINMIEDDLNAGTGKYVPDYITGTVHVPVIGSKVTTADFTPNRINVLDCSKGKVTIESGTHLKNLVVMASCEVQFGQGALLEDVVVFNSDTSAKSFNSPNGFQIGLNDYCATGGGAQLVTRGGLNVASSLQMYGGQIIAQGDVEFAANADGLQGATILSGGMISGTSNMNMGFCGNGMEDNFAAPYFRLAL
ncbi:MAG: pilus assembly protein TadG-related protein [Pseudooceanicola sp.]